MTAIMDVFNKCTACGLCVNECAFLTGLGKTPKEASEDLLGGIDATKTYPFSCFLCSLCKAVCPNEIDVAEMFLEARRSLASIFASSNACYRLFFADEEFFVMDAYKKHRGISYEAFSPQTFKYAFFPGCAMACFSPKAVTKTYELLKEELQDVGIIDLCCGKPIYDVGLTERAMKWLMDRVVGELKRHECTTLITACPNCYYYLKRVLPKDFALATVYDFIGSKLKDKVEGLTLTIHDSCPDRFEGLFARHVRDILSKCRIIEMEHSKEKTMCCGASGLVSCIDPSLSSSLMSNRINEAVNTGASLMVVYCYSCANMFWSFQPSIEVKHVLNLVLNVEDESEAIRQGELTKIIMEIMTKQQ
ncbi:MAG: hypothetical protein DRJ60_04390 [Thermoprotei archaeon]|nr:MAG: hypothetical protein DRJ60_04390 [Thermoprotei archaeon]